jgi:hypothetical protein
MGSSLSRPFPNPRRQLIQIDAIEADLAPVPPRFVQVEERVPPVQLVKIVGGKVLVERLGKTVVPTLGKLGLDLAVVFVGIVDFVADDGLLQPLALAVDDMEVLPAELKRFRLRLHDLRGQFLLRGGLFLGLLRLGLGLEDRVKQGRGVAKQTGVALIVTLRNARTPNCGERVPNCLTSRPLQRPSSRSGIRPVL